MRILRVFLFLLLLLPGLSAAQYRLRIISGQQELVGRLKVPANHPTLKARSRAIDEMMLSLHENAYLAASIDSTHTDSTHLTVYLEPGQRYKWAVLRPGNVDESVLNEAGYREKLYFGRPFRYREVRKLQERIIRHYENNGYPFASVKLDSIVIGAESISAVLHVEKYTLQKIDSVMVSGTLRLQPAYLYNYLGVHPGDIYNESRLLRADQRLRELSFVSVRSPSTILFTEKYNRLNLYLDKKRSSQFDGVLGVLPDNKTGKILFTGDVRLRLQNGLGYGELIDLNWKRLQTATQDLKVKLVYPYVLRTPFGIDYNFKLYKRDTTFLDVFQNAGIQYLLAGGSFLKVFYTHKSSSLLSAKAFEASTQLPPFADIRANMYGLGFFFERLDYRFNPRRGFSLSANAGAGTRNIRRNSDLNPVVYEGLDLSTAQYTADCDLSVFIPVGSRSAVRLGNQSAFIANPSIFQNELFRIGGLRSLRGFDEESIFASAYSIGTAEYRFLLEQNSFLYLFGDLAWYESRFSNTFVTDTPFGFGAGVSFETKAGIFSINYALGSQFGNPIQLRSGKIHFGLVNYF